jgi:DNA replication protein DnaC
MKKDFIPCRKCKGKNGLPDGYYYTNIERNNHQYKVVHECDHHKQYILEKELYTRFIKSGFQSDLFEYDISTYLGTKSIDNINRLTKYLMIISTPEVLSSMLYFYGPPGAQKSTVANWVGKCILASSHSCKYILMNQLILMLHKSNIDEEVKEKLSEYEECDIIIIDESFTQKSQWGGYFDNFIKDRINNGKGVIFISNHPPSMISTNGFSKNIQDLVERELLKRNSMFVFEDIYFNTQGAIPKVLF